MNPTSDNNIIKHLPLTKKEIEQRGWDQVDVIIVSGDAYVDHPSFGHAVIGRIIESLGFRIAIIAQPNWRDDLRDFRKFGAPRLFFGVTSGCMDSMVNHYTANKRLRSNDAYTPGGKSGFRPDYATTVYSRILKKLYPHVPVIIGGMEASMRRATHYDYWSDCLMPSILVSSGADLLVYGMGEQPLRAILKLMDKGVPLSSLQTVPQTALLIDRSSSLPKNKKWQTVILASHEQCLDDKKSYASNFRIIEKEANSVFASRITQEVDNKLLIINPPFATMTEKEIDASFDLPYTRLPHPRYRKRGAIPAYEMIKFSVNMHRGCFGGCSFCAISGHQGKMVASRSKKSILNEVDAIANMPDFKGFISDLGGPSANMYGMKGIKQSICDKCTRPSCIYPSICYNLNTSHEDLTDIYQRVSAHKKVKKAFVTSGIRYDLFVDRLEDFENSGYREYAEELITNHVSGRLKVAPEHTSEKILKMMRKPSYKSFISFKKFFDRTTAQKGLSQQIVPYFIASHPACESGDMAELAARTKDTGFRLEQVQDFTPTPMTLSTVIYYSGYDPYTLKPVYSAKSSKERSLQNRFFFWYKKENRDWIRKTLGMIGKKELLEKFYNSN